jgi:hypothetical protein
MLLVVKKNISSEIILPKAVERAVDEKTPLRRAFRFVQMLALTFGRKLAMVGLFIQKVEV